MPQKSFTLIELLIYSAVISAVLLAASAFLWNIVWGNIKETAFQEAQQNSRFALTKITQEIKKAKSIIAPSPGFPQNSISLEMANASLSPTIFDLDQQKIRMTQGVNPPVFLTSDQAIITNFLFTNLSYPATPGAVRAEINDLKSTISLLPGAAP